MLIRFGRLRTLGRGHKNSKSDLCFTSKIIIILKFNCTETSHSCVLSRLAKKPKPEVSVVQQQKRTNINYSALSLLVVGGNVLHATILALVAITATGLIIALPVQTAYNYFTNKVSNYSLDMETSASMLLETFSEVERQSTTQPVQSA